MSPEIDTVIRISWRRVQIVRDFSCIMKLCVDLSGKVPLYEHLVRSCTRSFVAYASQQRFVQVLLWEAPYDTPSVDASLRLYLTLELMRPVLGIYTSRGLC